MVRNSLRYVSWKQRKEVAADLKLIYGSATAEQAEMELSAFEAKWDATHPTIGMIWRRNWDQITPFFAYPADIRKVIYTTNAIESLNMSLRKVTKNRGSFPNDEAMLKLLYLALRNIAKKWTLPIRDWKAAMNRFTILFEPESANLFWLDYALSDSVTILPSLSPRGAEITPAPWLLKKVTLYFGFRIVFSPC
jgi:putative transposase